MYRAIVPDGEIGCEDYERQENGVELYNQDGDLVAFAPYANLRAIINEDAYAASEDEDGGRAIM